ncbi:hypothetical protein [Paenibacillus monticola]|uniref:hypothetical protein n=1 Tax=Paenibacillus monticola TaxID=2666075 RepID=UPI001E322354|nr:hypothetical protein [Paenibacillus monticola]
MARTKTRKALLKAERSGMWSEVNNRRINKDYGAISQHVRVTPSKREQLNKIKHKERIFHDGAPFVCDGFNFRQSVNTSYQFSALHTKLLG